MPNPPNPLVALPPVLQPPQAAIQSLFEHPFFKLALQTMVDKYAYQPYDPATDPPPYLSAVTRIPASSFSPKTQEVFGALNGITVPLHLLAPKTSDLTFKHINLTDITIKFKQDETTGQSVQFVLGGTF